MLIWDLVLYKYIDKIVVDNLYDLNIDIKFNIEVRDVFFSFGMGGLYIVF